jgi:serine/threonine-protein kinase PpkA
MSNESKEPIPGYRILDNLGSGGFARVYLAEQQALERQVALKVMSPKLANDVEYCERFIREGRTLAKLSDHPDIVTIFDIGQVDQFFFMAMEYLGGADLKDMIGPGGYVGSPTEVLRTVTRALGHAHKRGVVHRDIKPANVLFNDSGKAILSDFGIAKSLQQTDETLTAIGTQIGTPSYMSPEQCRGEAEIDGRSDLYSMGVMLYEMLTGKKPYTGADFMSICIKHINEPVPTLPDEHAAYQPLLNALMAKDRDQRIATAEEFLELMEQHFPEQPAIVVAEPSPLNWKLPAAIAAAVLITAIGGWLGYRALNPPVEEVALVAVPSPGLPTEVHDKVQRLLDSAQMHEIVGRYVSPPGSNALDAYKMIVEIDDANEFAIDAIKRLEAEHGS